MSNYIGYTLEDNIARKAENIAENYDLPQTMNRVKASSGKIRSEVELRNLRLKSKSSPVKAYTTNDLNELYQVCYNAKKNTIYVIEKSKITKNLTIIGAYYE